MRTTDPPGTERMVPDDYTARTYLEKALDAQWNLDTEYVGQEADMRKCWELQNELRRANGIEELTVDNLESACEHFHWEES